MSAPSAPQIVVGFDSSVESVKALRVASDLAARLGAELHVLHVIDLGDYPIDPDGPDWEDQATARLSQHRAHVGDVLADRSGMWSYHAERGGGAAQRLSDLAEDLDALLIVVGTRGGGIGPALRRLLDGSVSRGLVRGHSRPVLVVPFGKAHPPTT
jgi:nucleotide-binding universal stress UspA family protein